VAKSRCYPRVCLKVLRKITWDQTYWCKLCIAAKQHTYVNVFVLFLSQHSNYQKFINISLCNNEFIVLYYDIALYVSAPKAIIRRYNLTNIFLNYGTAPYIKYKTNKLLNTQ
jgi:hypothetical protein